MEILLPILHTPYPWPYLSGIFSRAGLWRMKGPIPNWVVDDCVGEKNLIFFSFFAKGSTKAASTQWIALLHRLVRGENHVARGE